MLAASDFYGAKAESFGTPRDRILRIYHGVDLARFAGVDAAAARAVLGVAADRLLVVCAGRLAPRKGLHELVDAAALVAPRVDRFHLLIAGECSSVAYAEELLARIERRDIGDCVTVRQDLVLDDMPGLFAAADIVTQPSEAEGLGLAVIEAMAAQRAVVATAVSGIVEERFAAAGRDQAAARFTIDRMVTETEAAYETAAEYHRRRADQGLR